LTSISSGFFSSRAENTPIGLIEVLASDTSLVRVNLLGREPTFYENAYPIIENAITQQAISQILEYLNGSRREFSITIDWKVCTPFQKQVLTRTMQIGYGQVMTYGQLASELGKPAASRAVGGAMASNPLPIVVPCHRVVAADGRLTGYSAADGIRTKQWLLELEGHKIVREKLA
jgi:methylated-DNA-[protein]-cysteine S-methyltransferase